MSRRLLLGGNQAVLRVAKPSFDAEATDISRIVFSEKFKTLHVLSRITVLSNTLLYDNAHGRTLFHENFGFYPLIQYWPTSLLASNGSVESVSIVDRTLTSMKFSSFAMNTSVVSVTVVFFNASVSE